MVANDATSTTEMRVKAAYIVTYMYHKNGTCETRLHALYTQVNIPAKPHTNTVKSVLHNYSHNLLPN